MQNLTDVFMPDTFNGKETSPRTAGEPDIQFPVMPLPQVIF